MKHVLTRPLVLILALAMTAAVSLGVTGSASSTQSSAGTAERGVVATSPQGTMTSRLVGSTEAGREVTGKFYPTGFKKVDGKVKVRGLLVGVVHRADGTTSSFSATRSLRVKSVNGVPARSDAAARMMQRATCDVLHLRLAPLDLDLLGLVVHLDRVVLDIVAQSGAGKLLGNLVCAVAGLLDGGLGGQLRRLTGLLNDILAALRAGL